MNENRCIFCNVEKFELYFNDNKRKNINLLKCNNCGLIFYKNDKKGEELYSY